MHRSAEARWPPTDALGSLLLRLRRVLPGLDGRVGAPRADELTLEHPQSVARLLAHWRAACPEAGRHYWAARCWTLLVWQPIYLQVLAVRLAGQAPCLDGLAQGVEQGFVAGFCLPDHQSGCTPSWRSGWRPTASWPHCCIASASTVAATCNCAGRLTSGWRLAPCPAPAACSRYRWPKAVRAWACSARRAASTFAAPMANSATAARSCRSPNGKGDCASRPTERRRGLEGTPPAYAG